VWYTFYRRNDKLCIPGTSIKGAIRAIVEAISNSCVSQYRRSEGKSVPQTHEPCRNTRQLCPACRLFGVTGFRGRVHFADALPEGEVRHQVVKIGELWEPRRDQGRKFYEVKQVPTLSDQRPQQNFRFVEALPKGTRFQTTLHFENLTEGELGLLAYALGWQPKEGKLDRAFPPKLGGAKPRCFGAVEFQLKGLQLWEHARNRLLQKRRIPDQEALGLIAGWMKRACDEHLLHEPSWKKLTDGMRAQDSTCPQGVY
jgi:CRISPR/Cas system CSM-associated protein Csm3 (group 7 of RAMP superfamily)